MQMKKRMTTFVLSLLLLLGLSVPAAAHDVPDLTRQGQISVTMAYQGKTVSGGTLTLYRVGQVHEDDGNYDFQPTGDFASCGASFADVTSSALAASLAQYAKNHDLSGVTKQVGADGKVAFSNLEVGLYLLVQNKAADGYRKAKPFLVSLPYLEDGVYRYEVDASPKVELTRETTPTNPPKTPPKPSTPKTPGGKLPQTGQLNWPVPVLSILGLCLFAGGWFLRFGKKERHEA